MKLQASPAHDPRAGWRTTILRARRDIQKRLRRNPSLRGAVPAMIAEALADTPEIVRTSLAEFGETPVLDPAALTYTERAYPVRDTSRT